MSNHRSVSSHPQSSASATSGGRRRWVAILVRILLPAVVLSAGAWGFNRLRVEPDEAIAEKEETPAVRTRVTELVVQDYPVVVTTHGTVQARNEVALSSEVAGLVRRVSPAFEAGAYFSANDVLVELDARDYRTAVAIAKSQVAGAEAALQLAIQNHDRTQTLFQRTIASEAEVHQAEASRAQAAAELDSARAQLTRAERDLERTKIVAPFDGRVRQKSVGVGQSVTNGTPLGVVFAVDYAEIRLPIAGREFRFLELPELADDPPVAVELRDGIDTESDVVWHGQIVRTEGVLDADSLELFAIAHVDDPFGRTTGTPPLRIGQPVVASITGQIIEDVVALPRGAVRQLDRVFLIEKQELTLFSTTIEPIWSDQHHVIVRDPRISSGTLLSTTHLPYAPDGARVEIIDDVELTAAQSPADGQRSSSQ